MRRAAAHGLAIGRDQADLPLLQELSHDPDPIICAWAATGLVRFRKRRDQALAATLRAFGHRDQRASAIAMRALRWLVPAPVEAVPCLVELLTHPHWRTVVMAAQSLGRIGAGANDGVPALMHLAQQGQPTGRRAALVALGDIGDVRALDLLLQLVGDATVGRHAVHALNMVGLPFPQPYSVSRHYTREERPGRVRWVLDRVMAGAQTPTLQQVQQLLACFPSTDALSNPECADLYRVYAESGHEPAMRVMLRPLQTRAGRTRRFYATRELKGLGAAAAPLCPEFIDMLRTRDTAGSGLALLQSVGAASSDYTDHLFAAIDASTATIQAIQAVEYMAPEDPRSLSLLREIVAGERLLLALGEASKLAVAAQQTLDKLEARG